MESKKAQSTEGKAVIYCRVSDTKQTTRGTGLKSQETRCREYASFRGYDVVQVFTDDASGGLIDRPGMQSMLAYLRKHRRQPHVVIIDDISRLARGLHAHMELRSAIAKSGGILESPSLEFGEDSDSQLIENLLASVSQHQRQKNGEQTLNRMRSRALNGYWVFHAPIGYRFERVSGQGKVLHADEPYASIIREALEGYAAEKFSTQAEVKRFLEVQPEFPKTASGEVTNQRVNDLLTQPLYAGYLELPKWDVSLRPAKHEGLITFETFKTIQDRLNGIARVPARKDINEDFPLRGFVQCGCCGNPLTANWSKGKTASYPYYLCRQKGCEAYGKSIRREVVEGDFGKIIKSLRPSEDLFEFASSLFRDLWDQRGEAMKARRQSMTAEVSQVDRKIAQLMDRLVEADSESVVRAYEKRIGDLEMQRAVLRERIEKCGKPLHTYEESFELSMAFLSNPWFIWENGGIEHRQTVLKLAFEDNLAYCRENGFRTPKISMPFKALEDICSGKMEMAHRGRFELPTP
ncbi:MAG: recombinase family protein [Pseudomonadota bacterium]